MSLKDFLLCTGGLLLGEFLVELTRIKWRKDCKYDCSKCRVFDCPYHHCQYLKNKEKDK